MTARGAGLIAGLALLTGCAQGGETGEAGRPLSALESSGELPVLPIGGDFTLTDQDGQRFSLSSLSGKVVLIFFGYTMCPDACPTTPVAADSAVTISAIRSICQDSSMSILTCQI